MLSVLLSLLTIFLIAETRIKNVFLKSLLFMSLFEIVLSCSNFFFIAAKFNDNFIDDDVLFVFTNAFSNLAILSVCTLISTMFTAIGFYRRPIYFDKWIFRIQLFIIVICSALSIPAATVSLATMSTTPAAAYGVVSAATFFFIMFNFACIIFMRQLLAKMPTIQLENARSPKRALKSLCDRMIMYTSWQSLTRVPVAFYFLGLATGAVDVGVLNAKPSVAEKVLFFFVFSFSQTSAIGNFVIFIR